MREGEGGGETAQGWCAGAGAYSVNDATVSTRRLQLCLSEQQCRHVEHESRLAGACQGPVLLFPVALSSAEGKKMRGGEF